MKNITQASDVSDALMALKQIVSEDTSSSYIENEKPVREKFVLDQTLRVQGGSRRSYKSADLSFEAKLARLETLLNQAVEDEFEDEHVSDTMAPIAEVSFATPFSEPLNKNSEPLVEGVKPDAVSQAQVPSAVSIDRNSLQSDAVPFDKEQMREMVSELIREELSGLFGEKITANIRKMVQREVTIAKLTTNG